MAELEAAPPVQYEVGREPEEGSALDKVRDVAQQARDKVREGGEKITEATRGAASQARDLAQDAKQSVVDVAHKARDTASDWSHRAGRETRQIKDRGEQLFRANPIAIGAAALALGTIVGLAMPRTEREDEMIGGKRDRVLGKAQEVAHEAFQKAEEVVRNTGSDKEDEGEPQYH